MATATTAFAPKTRAWRSDNDACIERRAINFTFKFYRKSLFLWPGDIVAEARELPFPRIEISLSDGNVNIRERAEKAFVRA